MLGYLGRFFIGFKGSVAGQRTVERVHHAPQRMSRQFCYPSTLNPEQSTCQKSIQYNIPRPNTLDDFHRSVCIGFEDPHIIENPSFKHAQARRLTHVF